jgi:DNA-binding NarL/FixJ family response regulator
VAAGWSLTLDQNRRVELTPREWDVLELFGDGLSTAEIARRLDLSQVTVRRHMSALLHKLEVSSREEARRLIAQQADPSAAFRPLNAIFIYAAATAV